MEKSARPNEIILACTFTPLGNLELNPARGTERRSPLISVLLLFATRFPSMSGFGFIYSIVSSAATHTRAANEEIKRDKNDLCFRFVGETLMFVRSRRAHRTVSLESLSARHRSVLIYNCQTSVQQEPRSKHSPSRQSRIGKFSHSISIYFFEFLIFIFPFRFRQIAISPVKSALVRL